MPIKRIDRYILSEVAGPFLGGTLFFVFVFLMFQALRLAEFLIVHGISGLLLSKMVFLLVVSFLPMVLPVSFLISVLIAFGRLSADSELVALKAAGVGIWRMSAPVVALSVPVVALSIALNTDWVPWSERAFKEILIKIGNTKVASAIKEGTFTTGFFDLLIYADEVDTSSNKLKRVFIYDEREAKTPLTVVAKEGQLLPVRTGTDLGNAVLLTLRKGNIHVNDADSESYQRIDYDDYSLYLKILEGDDATALKPKMLSYASLVKRMGRRKLAPSIRQELKTEFWRRYSIALSPLIFAFLGVGFGSARTRSVRAGAALVAFVSILLYYTVQIVATSAAHKGWIAPWLAMQLPNLAALAIAARAFKRASW